ncbi:MAG: DEAD/DEAH box helicase [Myxococcales bacterium]|nr:MAG: DEAD/DEAH box helicase [Myxococcales bacterium]
MGHALARFCVTVLPFMPQDFSTFGLQPALIKAIDKLGFTEATPVQTSVIPLLCDGRDVIAQAQTGTGKTAAFALPILQLLEKGHPPPQALILAPTRELALQVADSFTNLAAFLKIRVAAVYGGQAYGPQLRELRSGVDVVVGTPGRILDLVNRKVIKLEALRFLVLDEADQMLSLGFIEDIEEILKGAPKERVSALFSATLPKEIQRLAKNYLTDPEMIKVKANELTAENVEQRYVVVPSRDKKRALVRVLEMENLDRAMIFCDTRAATTQIADGLNTRGFSAAPINGDLSQAQREYVLQGFRDKRISILVATDVAARGLHIDGVSHVINFDVPRDPEIYVHRIGRTGRAGGAGIAISLFTPGERRRLMMIERYTKGELEQGSLPTVKAIRKHRNKLWQDKISAILNDGDVPLEKGLVEKLMHDGHSAEDVAAAALWLARKEEHERPIEEIGELEAEPRSERPRGRRSGPGRSGPPRRAGGPDDRPRRSGSKKPGSGPRPGQGGPRKKPVGGGKPPRPKGKSASKPRKAAHRSS